MKAQVYRDRSVEEVRAEIQKEMNTIHWADLAVIGIILVGLGIAIYQFIEYWVQR